MKRQEKKAKQLYVPHKFRFDSEKRHMVCEACGGRMNVSPMSCPKGHVVMSGEASRDMAMEAFNG